MYSLLKRGISVMLSYNPKQKKSTQQTPIWYGKRRQYLIGLVGMGILQAVVITSFSLLIAHLINLTNRIDSLSFSILIIPLSLIILAAISLMLLRWGEKVFAEHIGQDYINTVRLKLFKHLLNSDQRASQRFSHGAMMLRFVTDLNGLRRWVSLGLSRLLVIASTAIVTLSLLYYSQPILVALTGTSVIVGLAISLIIGSRLSDKIRAVRKYRSRLAATMNDRIATVGTVQICAQEKRETRRVRRQSQQLYDALLQRAHILGALQGTLEGTIILSTGIVLIAGIMLVANQLIGIGEVVAGMTLVNLLLTPLRDLGRIFDYWKQWQISQEKIAYFLKLPKRQKMLTPHKQMPLSFDPGRIEAYDLTISGIIKSTNFIVNSGEHILLVGKNGAGKSSFLLNLAGIIPITKGKLIFDGYNINEISSQLLTTGGIGLVSQDLGLMRGSLKRNLTYANSKASPEEIKHIIQRCHLATLIKRLPKGLESQIVEGGKNLSTGERKRILLARTLLNKPKLLLLDEIDANLDKYSIRVIEKILNEFSGTIIQVTHNTYWNFKKPYRIWQLKSQQIHEYEQHLKTG